VGAKEQKQSHGASFDHLIGRSEQCRRQVEAERFGGFEIDGELDRGRLLDWRSPGFAPLRMRSM
jgi:hypothetical protein